MGHAKPMRVVERITYLAHQLHGLIETQTPLAEQLSKILTIDMLHDKVTHIQIAAEIVNGDNVWMAQFGQGLGFTLEALQELWVRCDVIGNDLDRHFAAQLELFSTVDHAHGTTTQLAQNFVVRKDHGNLIDVVIIVTAPMI